MEIHEVQVDTFPSLTLPWQEILLMPIGDIQHGAQGVDLKKLKKHIQWGVDHNAYFTGMGDYIDVASPSGREKIENAHLYDSVRDALDDRVYELLDEVKQALAPSRGRWLALNKGHHLWEFKSGEHKGRDTDDVLAEYLGCPVSDVMGVALTQVKFRNEKGNRALACQVWQWHGEGSGQTMAAPLNKLEKEMSRWPTVDVFLIGHYSRKVGYPVDALAPVFGKNPRLTAKRRILACTGGFVKGYTVSGRASYVEKAAMPPTNLGGLVVRIRPVHEESQDRLDMNVEA